ncbi:allantoicase [Amycolatopsis sp. SID8362]|uniref:allantoicase n=1 Tax=Amycolatopsis sp. SID8362 TaxID=2690346 RepID=UPI001370D82F|nr:allantoicase [Amycolatopsis sp. SID8362]NBH04682.1 allantoicase [Amycolatopsis sp. SID8362]NED41382.1 allantoicase [Amycolatopsis sp. SID8362]
MEALVSDRPEWTELPDLASRRFGGTVMWATDELFAEKENLVNPWVPAHRAETFGPKGQVYDGWETRRHREPGDDQAVLRLGLAGTVTGVIVDTAFFKGNYPPFVSVEAASVPGYPSAAELATADWDVLVDRAPAAGHTENFYTVNGSRRYTHVRLTQHPDGGVARLRVHGVPIPDPDLLDLDALDLAALENGAVVTGCSNKFYSSPNNLLSPGLAAHQAEGWETARRRDDGNDWVTLRLAGAGHVRFAELDTSNLKGNAPGWASVSGRDTYGEWVDLLPKTRLQPDTRHRFALKDGPEVTEARLDIYPDGGLARLRLFGRLTEAGRTNLKARFAKTR